MVKIMKSSISTFYNKWKKKNLIPQTIIQLLCHNYDMVECKWLKKKNDALDLWQKVGFFFKITQICKQFR